jgi:hypothetical protein
VGIVARYPYVEDRTLALEDETLVLRVAEERVSVDALFHFRAFGDARDRVATFPIGAPRAGAESFRVTLEGPAAIERAEARVGAAGALPVGKAVEHWDIFLDGDALARHDGVVRVTYAQPGHGEFTYVLRTGAYWRGPIRRLDVVVEDPARRLVALVIEDRTIDALDEARHVVSLFDVEPRTGIRLVTR